jgi:hypothetical protein
VPSGVGVNALPGWGNDEELRRPREEEPVAEDQFDVDMEDGELLEEVELTTDLIVAASETDGRLPQDRIDEILGVPIPRPRPGD